MVKHHLHLYDDHIGIADYEHDSAANPDNR